MRRHEGGQVLPVLLLLFVALMAAGAVLFQVGKGSVLAAQAKTASDAAATAAAKNMRTQLLAMYAAFGYADPALINPVLACAAAEAYARRNDANIVSCSVQMLEVQVSALTDQEIGTAPADVASDERGLQKSRAEVKVGLLGAVGIPSLGFSAINAVVRAADWRELANLLDGGKDLVTLGAFLAEHGFQVGEHPAFGGVAGTCNNDPHVQGSWHCRNGAIDVNADGAGAGEMAALDAIANKVADLGFHVLWRVEGHFNHMHIDIGAAGIGGDFAGSALGPAAFEIILIPAH